MSYYPSLAITGGIGSGKSTVLELFEKAGYNVINMDKMAHSFMTSDSTLYPAYAKEIDNWLGSDFIHQKEIDKAWVREKLKTLPQGYQTIASIAAPYIEQATSDTYQKMLYEGRKVVFEVPLLVEMHMEQNFAAILVVTCQLDIKKARVRARDPHLDENMIEQRISIQSSDEEKKQIADFILDNSGTKEQLTEQFNLLLPLIQKRLENKKILKP